MSLYQPTSSRRLFSLSPGSATLLVAILAVGLLPRCYSLTTRSLWLDEAVSWRLTQFPLPEMMARVAGDTHPPLYFLLLKGWTAVFGDSMAGLRSLSVLMGCLTCLGVFLFGREVFSEKTGLLAAALTALSAFQVRYSWEARMYSLLTALTIFSSWALFRALRDPAKTRWWGLFGLLDLLLAYTHYYGLFLVAAQFLFLGGLLLFRIRRHPTFAVSGPFLLGPALALALIVVGWLPWLPTFLQKKAEVQQAFWGRPMGFWEVPRLCYQMFVAPENLPATPRPHYLAPAGLCLLGLVFLLRQRRSGAWYVVCLAVCPLLGCLVAQFFHIHIFTLRYFVPTHLFLLMGVAVLLQSIPLPLERATAIAVALAGSFAILLHFFAAMDVQNRPGARAVAERIARQRRPGEPIIVATPHNFLPLLYHATDRSAHYYTYGSGQAVPHYLGASSFKGNERLDAEGLARLSVRRVWVVNILRDYQHNAFVRAPAEWVVRSEDIIPDVFGIGDFLLVAYDTTADGPNAAAATSAAR